jgi:hypothetical protein
LQVPSRAGAVMCRTVGQAPSGCGAGSYRGKSSAGGLLGTLQVPLDQVIAVKVEKLTGGTKCLQDPREPDSSPDVLVWG